MRDLSVIYRDVDSTDSRMQRGFGGAPTKISGVDWMIQKITKYLFTITGSNTYTPGYGTLFESIVGTTKTEAALNKAKGLIAQAVLKIESDIKNEQMLNIDSPDSERLRSLTIEGINFDRGTTTWYIQLAVTMENSSTFNVRY